MAVVGNLTAAPSTGYVIPRPRLIGFRLSWWTGATLLTPGQTSLYGQAQFPHVQMHVKYYDWVWQWSTKSIPLLDMIEDAWAIFLPNPAQQYFGNATMTMTWNNYARGWIVDFNLPSSPQQSWVQQFPPHPTGYYNPPYPENVTYPFLIP